MVLLGQNVDDYKDPGGRYTVRVPAGWAREEHRDLTIFTMPGKALTTLGIFCQEGATINDLISSDASVAQNVGRRTVIQNIQTQVAGVPARAIDSTTALSTTVLSNSTYYFEGRGCAWRVQLTTALGQDFRSLLAKVVQSFLFTS